MERLSKEQIEAVIQEAKERCPYYGEPDGCNAHGGPLMCCDELDEVGELAKAACALGTVEELSALVKARDKGRVVVLPEDGMLYHFEEIPETGERWVGNKPIQKITFTCGFGLVGMPFDFSQLGRTFFLTRAEAEAALQEGGHHETDPV